MSVDPLIKYHESPYIYASGNPIMFIDPNGMDTVEIGNALNTAVTGDVIDWGDGEYSNMQNLPNMEVSPDPVQQLYNRVRSLRESPEFKERQRIGGYGGTIVSEGNGVTYEQVTSNTLVRYGPDVDYPEYKFIYPHDQGTWDTPGSDGLYWKGCMSCHSSLGAYNYAAYNSRERLAGTVAAAALNEFVGGMLMTIPAAQTSTNVLSTGELLRIENAATRINKPITVVGSRASGKAGAYSDWDYVIEGGLKNSREWSKIKNSLPGARSTLDNTPRNIDILPGPVREGSPYIRIYPR